MYRRSPFDRFQFDDHLVLNYQISPEPLIKFHAVPFNGHGNLPPDIQSAPFEFAREHGFIHRFEQSRPQSGMQPITGVHDDFRDFVFFHGLILFSRTGAKTQSAIMVSSFFFAP